MEITTHDTYEAAYYIVYGASFKNISFGKIQKNRWSKLGITQSYLITLVNVDPVFVGLWKEQTARVNARDFANSRRKLKIKINNEKKRLSQY